MSNFMNVRKVVTPIDFSDNSRLIAEAAGYLTGKFGAELYLIFVVQNFEDYSGFFIPHMNMPSLEEEIFSGAEEKMVEFVDELKETLLGFGVKEVFSKVFMGDVAEQIVRYTEKIESDMVVMGTHGYKGLEKIMFGSVADKVVRSAACPVLTINPYTCCNRE